MEIDYFSHNQKVYLINISDHRDKELYESLSGFIIGRGAGSLTLRIPYSTEYSAPADTSRQLTFKLITHAMGSGIQTIADLIRVEAGTTFYLKLRGILEMYQYRRVPRVDATVKLFQGRCANSLGSYRGEFRRITDFMKVRGVPSNLPLREVATNLGVGGIRIAREAKGDPAPLLLFVIELNDNGLPICALGDLVWDHLENSTRMCGYRFIQISKTDQERIRGFIWTLQKKQNIINPEPSVNWELLDTMMDEVAFRAT